MLGVIGLLVFIGIELRQCKTVAIAATLQGRNNTAVAGFYEFLAAGLGWHSFMLDQKFENDFLRDLIARRDTRHLSGPLKLLRPLIAFRGSEKLDAGRFHGADRNHVQPAFPTLLDSIKRQRELHGSTSVALIPARAPMHAFIHSSSRSAALRRP